MVSRVWVAVALPRPRKLPFSFFFLCYIYLHCNLMVGNQINLNKIFRLYKAKEPKLSRARGKPRPPPHPTSTLVGWSQAAEALDLHCSPASPFSLHSAACYQLSAAFSKMPASVPHFSGITSRSRYSGRYLRTCRGFDINT